jgi:hypothetical protein
MDNIFFLKLKSSYDYIKDLFFMKNGQAKGVYV